MKLLMIRHAKAQEREGWSEKNKLPDEKRPLTDEGIEEFEQVARQIKRLFSQIDVIHSSPSLRTLQTAKILGKLYPETKQHEHDVLLQGSPWKDFQTFLLKQQWSKDGLVAVIGHENHFSETLGSLIGCPRSEAIRFKKGGVALIDLELMENSVIGKLLLFASPKSLIKLAS